MAKTPARTPQKGKRPARYVPKAKAKTKIYGFAKYNVFFRAILYDLTQRDALVLGILIDHADSTDLTTHGWLRMADIAECMHVSTRTIERAIKSLIEQDWIEIIKYRNGLDKNGTPTSNKYALSGVRAVCDAWLDIEPEPAQKAPRSDDRLEEMRAQGSNGKGAKRKPTTERAKKLMKKHADSMSAVDGHPYRDRFHALPEPLHARVAQGEIDLVQAERIESHAKEEEDRTTRTKKAERAIRAKHGDKVRIRTNKAGDRVLTNRSGFEYPLADFVDDAGTITPLKDKHFYRVKQSPHTTDPTETRYGDGF